MKKRITGLALLMLLLFASGALAATPSIRIKTTGLPSTKVGNENYGEANAAAVEFTCTGIPDDAVLTVKTDTQVVEEGESEGDDEDDQARPAIRKATDPATPDGTTPGVFEAKFIDNGSHTVADTDTFYVTGKVWKVGQVPVTVTLTATWKETTKSTGGSEAEDENNEDEDNEDEENENEDSDDDANTTTVTKTASVTKKFNIISTAYVPSEITLADASSGSSEEDDEALPARKTADNEATFMSLVQDDGYNGLNTKHAVKDNADVFKVTATLPVTFKAIGLPSGLNYEISKIEINGGSGGSEEEGDEALPARKADELNADANTEATSLQNGGKSADITFRLVGTPRQSGVFNPAITVTNAAGSSTSERHQLLVFEPVKFTTAATQNVTWGKEFTIALKATGGLTDNPVSFDYADDDDDTAAALTALGLTFDKETGEISGTIDKNDAEYDKMSFSAGDDDDESLPARKKEASVTADTFKFNTDDNLNRKGEPLSTKSITLRFKAKSPGVIGAASGGDGEEDEDSLPSPRKAANDDSTWDETNELDVTKTFTLVIKAVAPAIEDKNTLQETFNTAIKDISISTETGAIEGGEDFEFPIYANGPGVYKWTVTNLPTGFISEDASDTDSASGDDDESEAKPLSKKDGETKYHGKYIKIKLATAAAGDEDDDDEAVPASKRDGVVPANIVQVLKNWPINITVLGAGGTDNTRLIVNLSSPEDSNGNPAMAISPTKDGLPSGAHNLSQDILGADLLSASSSASDEDALPRRKKVDDDDDDDDEGGEEGTVTYKGKEYRPIRLTAFPGPITWKTKNLPSGWILSVDKNYPFGTSALLFGEYKTAFKKANQVYEITATNTVNRTSVTVSNDITVYGRPVITTKSLPDITIGKKYSAKLNVSGLGVSVDVSIVLSKDDSSSADDDDDDSALPARKKADGEDFGDKEFGPEDGSYKLKFDATKMTLTGSFDRFWDTERTKTLKVTIKAKNPGYNVEGASSGGDDDDEDENALPHVRRADAQDPGAQNLTVSEFALTMKPVPPAFKTTKLSDYDGFGDNADDDGSGNGHAVTITGSKPMDVKVYIDGKSAKTIGLSSTAKDIVFFHEKGGVQIEEGGDDSGDDDDEALPQRKALPRKKALPGKKKAGDSSSPIKFNIERDTEKETTDTVILKLGYDADQGWAFASLPLTISVDNGSTKDGKGVTKLYKVGVKGHPPVLLSKDVKMSKDVTINIKAGEELPNYNLDGGSSSEEGEDEDEALPARKKDALTAGIFIPISGDEPIDWISSQKLGVTKNGIKVTSVDLGEDASPRKGFLITGKAGTLANKESKTTITLTATNSQTKVKSAARKITIVGQLVPEITTKPAAAKKEVEVGKSLSLKFAAKGTKPILWKIVSSASDGETDEETPDDEEASGEETFSTSRDLVAHGLSFDIKTGTFKGKPTHPTSDDTGKLYKPMTFQVVAYNDAGQSAPIVATIGVTGKKPKLSTLKAITLTLLSEDKETPTNDPDDDEALPSAKREGEDASGGTTGSRELRSDISVTDKNSYVSWDIVGKVAAPLTGLKVANSADAEGFETTGRNIGYLDLSEVSDLKAAKNIAVKVKASNYGAEATGNIKVTVYDPKPDFDADTLPYYIQLTGQEKKNVTGTATLTLKDYSKSSNNTTLDWKISRKPAGKVTAAIKPSSDKLSATITATLAKGLSSKDVRNKDTTDKIFHTSLAVTVTNKDTKKVAVVNISVDAKPYNAPDAEFPDYGGGESGGEDPENPEDDEALPAEKDEIPEDELPLGEGTVTYGDARNESSLTQAERRALAEGGYIIAAILPEITADESGLYELDVVSLDEAAPVDAELVWFAFPRNAEESEDDTIAEFYDDAGAEIFAVPEGRKVVPAPWLEADVTYAPVIAVKAPVAGGAKDSLDDAEEGDTVTEKAIEEATAE